MPKEKVELAAQAIYDKKGVNILALDVKGVSSLTDYVLIAEGNVDRHVVAIADEVIKTLKDQGEKPIYVEGRESGDWVVIDYLDYMVHIFMPGIRDKYQLEEMFRDGKIVELNLNVDS
jgi:ribosome-associated protein